MASRFNTSLLVCLFVLMVSTCSAGITFSGTFGADDQVVLVSITVPATETVTFKTVSFANGQLGFEPYLTLYNPSGAIFDQDYTGGTAPGGCGVRAIDIVSGACLDAFISNTLTAGVWVLALTEADNGAAGTLLTDGFIHDGEGNFTGITFGPGSGSFLLVDGSQRSNIWELDITGDGVTAEQIPEPGTLWTGAVVIAMLGIARRWTTRKNGGKTYAH